MIALHVWFLGFLSFTDINQRRTRVWLGPEEQSDAHSPGWRSSYLFLSRFFSRHTSSRISPRFIFGLTLDTYSWFLGRCTCAPMIKLSRIALPESVRANTHSRTSWTEILNRSLSQKPEDTSSFTFSVCRYRESAGQSVSICYKLAQKTRRCARLSEVFHPRSRDNSRGFYIAKVHNEK